MIALLTTKIATARRIEGMRPSLGACR